jgi:hypothetical protein
MSRLALCLFQVLKKAQSGRAIDLARPSSAVLQPAAGFAVGMHLDQTKREPAC